MTDLAGLGPLNAALKDLGLVGDGTDDAPLQGVVPVGIHLALGQLLPRFVRPLLTIAVGRRVVGRIDVVPCFGVGALGGLAVVVGPGTDETETALVLGLQQLPDDEARERRQELFGGVGDLLMHCC